MPFTYFRIFAPHLEQGVKKLCCLAPCSLVRQDSAIQAEDIVGVEREPRIIGEVGQDVISPFDFGPTAVFASVKSMNCDDTTSGKHITDPRSGSSKRDSYSTEGERPSSNGGLTVSRPNLVDAILSLSIELPHLGVLQSEHGMRRAARTA